MGRWSELPHGNDFNIDLFAHALNWYYHKTGQEPIEEFNEHACIQDGMFDPGLLPRLELRQGGCPVASEEELTESNFQIVRECLEKIALEEDAEEAAGVATTFCRYFNNESTGIFDTKGMPHESSPFPPEMNRWIASLSDNLVFKNYFMPTGDTGATPVMTA